MDVVLGMLGGPMGMVPVLSGLVLSVHGPEGTREMLCASPTGVLEAGRDLAPFEVGDFGAKRRLGWSGGGRSVRAQTLVVVARRRYAILVDPAMLTLVDAETSQAIVLAFDLSGALAAPPRTACIATVALGDAPAERLVLRGDDRFLAFPIEALARLADAPPRATTFRVETWFPFRDPAARRDANVIWLRPDNAILAAGTERWEVPHAAYGLLKGQTVVLRDAYWPGSPGGLFQTSRAAHYAVIEVPGRAPAALPEPVVPKTLEAKVSRSTPRDPASTAPNVAPAAMDGLLDDLYAKVVATPDDDGPRVVLSDALLEAGDSFGEFIALAMTGGVDRDARMEALRRRHQRAWLGPLAHFVEDVTYVRGLPDAGTVVRKPPTDPTIVHAAVHDRRLSTFAHLARGKAPPDAYARLVGSPRAIGLRRADVSDAAIIAALVAAGRTGLTQLDGVRLTKPAELKRLATATFDAAKDVSASVQPVHFRGFLERIIADPSTFFARVPRHVQVDLAYTSYDDLVAILLECWPSLPVAGIAVGDVVLRRGASGSTLTFHGVRARRDGQVVIAFGAGRRPDPFHVALLERYVPDLGEIRFTGGSPHEAEVAPLRQAFPRAAITVEDHLIAQVP